MKIGGKTGRKPVDVLARSKKPQGRPAVWAAIRQAGTFTVLDLSHETDVPRKTALDYVKALVAGGYVEELGPAGHTMAYRLVNDVGREAPRVRRDGSLVSMGRAQENLWRTMRMVGSFTATELAVQASTEETPVSVVAAADYCRYLALAGYLMVAGAGDARCWTFIPARYTGPLPPQIQRIKQVFDQNTRTVAWSREAPRG